MGIRLDKNSYSYARFSTHLRYLIQRLESGQQTEERGAEMLRSIAREYPQVYLCALRVGDYLKENWGWQCNKEETLYLMMHINRVQEQNDLPE
jgi:beta-glucoside operon transcriptional antiterminator